VLGRSQSIIQLEVGSLIPVVAGALLILNGWRVIRALWFPLLYLLFLVPLPGIFVVAITGPLKQGVSIVAENFLYMVGYPIARQGVTLSIGPYQLLVADACSGLHSIFSLSAIGLLYVYISRHTRWLRNLILVASLIPLAILANVVRVVVLVLVTYHFGDEAGQGFLHGAAGLVLFVIALALLFAEDKLLGYALPDVARRSTK
jgi:exosortase B